MKNFKRFFSVILTAALAAVMCITSVSAESIFDSAKEIQAGKKYSDKISLNTSKHNYKIQIDGKGTMSVMLTSDISHFYFKVYDSDGVEMIADKEEIKTGAHNGYYETNSSNGTFKGTMSYSVKKGTYYLQIEKCFYNEGKFSFSVSVPGGSEKSSDTVSSSKDNTVRIYMEKGDKVTLAAVTGDKNVSAASWKSSDEKIAKVSSNGKITAVKAGNCTVTWKSGSSTFTVYVEVE